MHRIFSVKNTLLFSLPVFILGLSSPAAADIVVNGTLMTSSVNELSSSTAYIINGMLDLHCFDNTIGSLAGPGQVTNGAGGQFTTLTTGGDGTDTTFSGIIQDGTAPFAITKTGNGSFTVSGNNTYQGGTTVNGGVFLFGNNNAAGTGAITTSGTGSLGIAVDGLTIANDYSDTGTGGTIHNNQGNTTYSGQITSGGTFTIDGGGTLTLGNAANSFASIFMDGTTVSINDAAALTSSNHNLRMKDFAKIITGANMTLSHTITADGNGAIMDTNGHDVVLTGGIVAGSIGTPSFEKRGAGILTLTGDNSASTVPTMISGGTLRAGSTNAFSDQADYMVDGTLDLNDFNNSVGSLSGEGHVTNGATTTATLTVGTKNSDTTFTGTITDGMTATLGLIKAGTGILTLSGENTYTGGTTINGGTLQIGDENHPDASITSNVVMGDGVGLSGHGTIHGHVTNNGGTVSPGGSIGTLTISGNYTQNAASTLAIEVSPEAASKLAVGGTASLAGTLAITFDAGSYTGKTYTLLTAGSVTGTFSSVTLTGGASTGLKVGAINYGSTAITFDLIPATPASMNVYTFNTANTATSIATAHHAGFTIFDHLSDANSNTETPSNAMTFVSLAGGGLTQAENISGGVAGLAKALPQVMKQNGGWFKATGNLASVDSSGTASGFSSETGGFMFGIDREIQKGLRVGAAGGYDHTELGAFNTTDTSTEDNIIRFALYASKALEDHVTVDGQLGYALHMLDADRFEISNGLTAKNSHDANEISASIQLSKAFNAGGFTIKPKAGMSYVFLSEDGYTEKGAGAFNTTINAKDTSSLRLFTGLGISKSVTSNGARFTPEAHVKYSYETLDSTSATSGALLGAGFTAKGVKPSNHALALGAGLSAKIDADLDAFGTYDVNLPTGNTFEQTFSAGVKYKF